jgi:hypothetical protein
LEAPSFEDDSTLSLLVYSVNVYGKARCFSGAAVCDQDKGGCPVETAAGPCNVSIVLLTEGARANVSAAVLAEGGPTIARLRVER